MRIIKAKECDFKVLLKEISERGNASHEREQKIVDDIVSDVAQRGDEALFEYTLKFDGIRLDPSNIKVSNDEIKEAYEQADDRFISIIKKAIKRITAFHENEKRKSWFFTEGTGSLLGQRVIPLKRAGLYVPGGKASYPSSVLMNIIPAKVAGVDEIIICTPCGRDGKVSPYTLVAANEAGVTDIYKIGGAQAVAAMAFGTASIPKVDKITGPGNIFVALAKKSVYGQVSIDSVAGPSEITVLADESADAEYVACDMLSQAEHDEMASAICVTTSEKLANDIEKYLELYTAKLERKDIIQKSLDDYGMIIIVSSTEEAAEAVNCIASEHLEIMTEDPFSVLPKIRNAGAVFLGKYSSEPLGDYMAGPNHVLPTSGTARFFSPLSVDDFIKKQSVINFNRESLELLHEDIEYFAASEGLTAHANSVAVRFRKEKN